MLFPSGIIWMKGESDALFEKSTLKYLKELLTLFRAAFLKDDLPIVIGKISDSGKGVNGKALKYCDLEQYAQENYANRDKYTSIVRITKHYEFIENTILQMNNR
jgi:hypothetical protein